MLRGIPDQGAGPRSAPRGAGIRPVVQPSASRVDTEDVTLPAIFLVALLPTVQQARPAAPAKPAQAQAPEAAAAHGPPLVAWADLVAQRSRLLGRRVRLHVQVSAPVETWNPYLTRFGPGEFAAFDAWSDQQLPWVRADFEEPAARLFVRHGSGAETVLAGAARFGRYEVVAEVRELFLDRPWVEVIAARPLAKSLGEGTVIHAARAQALIADETWRLAADELARALAGEMPAAARGALEAQRAACLERVGRR
jgi:hypothetical protein